MPAILLLLIILSFAPASRAQFDKEYVQQQNQQRNAEQKCIDFNRGKPAYLSPSNLTLFGVGETRYLHRLNGAYVLIDKDCSRPRYQLGKVYRVINGASLMLKEEEGYIYAYIKTKSGKVEKLLALKRRTDEDY